MYIEGAPYLGFSTNYLKAIILDNNVESINFSIDTKESERVEELLLAKFF